MNKNGVLNWAQELIETNPNNLCSPDDYIKHVSQVYDTAKIVVGNILSKYPNISMNGEEVVLAAGLHDIGRPLNKDQIFHELRGANYVERGGLKRGVANSLKDIYKIAQMIRSHGAVYESWQESGCAERRKEFEPLEICLLIPRTWQEAIVTYSDLASLNSERAKVKDRLDELLQKYESNPKYQNRCILSAVKNSQSRLLRLAERVEALEHGKLTEGDICIYGFL